MLRKFIFTSQFLIKQFLQQSYILQIGVKKMSLITEIHGWITIKCFYESSDKFDALEEEFLEDVLIEIKKFIEQCEFRFTEVNFYQRYEMTFLNICGMSWHYDECERVLQLYQMVSKIAKGSYGILYVQSEKDENIFKVYTLKRGSVYEQTDQFLSPCIPEIEDYPR